MLSGIAAGGRRGEGEKAGTEKATGTVPGQHGLEASQGQTYSGPCDFIGAAALSGTKKKVVFFVNTIAFSPNGVMGGDPYCGQ